MNWAKERDLLISQTMAFVQSISAPKPEADLRALSRTQSTPIAKAEPMAQAEPIAKAEPLTKASPITKAGPTEIKADPADKAPEVERPAGIVPMARLSLVPPGALREEVQSRVAAFRAHQQHFLRERDAYFHAVLDKARGSRDNPRKS